LAIVLLTLGWQGTALGTESREQDDGEERERRKLENSFGIPKDEPLADAVRHFNKEAAETAAKWHITPEQAPLTEGEVVAALRWAIETGGDRGPGFLAKCRTAVATLRLPKGAKLMLNTGVSKVAHRPNEIAQPDIAMWHIVLFFSIDTVPMQMSKEMVLVRLQFLNSR
jgi:hypothetical protein